jgi:hypothetical protein
MQNKVWSLSSFLESVLDYTRYIAPFPWAQVLFETGKLLWVREQWLSVCLERLPVPPKRKKKITQNAPGPWCHPQYQNKT